jgi:hypothetical protein
MHRPVDRFLMVSNGSQRGDNQRFVRADRFSQTTRSTKLSYAPNRAKSFDKSRVKQAQCLNDDRVVFRSGSDQDCARAQ